MAISKAPNAFGLEFVVLELSAVTALRTETCFSPHPMKYLSEGKERWKGPQWGKKIPLLLVKWESRVSTAPGKQQESG